MDFLETQNTERAINLLTSMMPAESKRAKCSARQAIIAASTGEYRTLAPRESERWGCIQNNPQHFEIPFEDLMPSELARRDLTVSNAASGGVTAYTDTEVLRLPLVGAGVMRTGATVVRNVTRDLVVPVMVTKPTFNWLGSESSGLSNDTALVLGEAAASFKRGGINLRVSRQLNLNARNLDDTIQRLLVQLANDALDLGVLNGSGAAGQPTGILSTAGVTSQSGTSLNMSGLAAMKKACVAADADDERLTWFGAEDTREKLRARELTSGGGSIWPGRELLGHRALVSHKMPSNTLLLGDFSNVTVLLYGSGIEVLVNPYADFKSGRIEFEVLLQMDLVVNYPASFAKATSIT
jgi:HK97 family phage major capsid protein